MASQPILHQEMNGGMDATSQPHLLKPNQWRLVHNMRVAHTWLEQVPQKKQLFTIGESPLLALANIPCGYLDYSSVVGLTRAHVWKIGATTYKQLTFEDGTSCSFVSPPDSRYFRHGTCFDNNRLFFVNPWNPVMSTDGACVRTMQRRASVFETAKEAKRVVKSVANDVPSGTYCAIFYDHLVVGRPIYRGTSYPWSVMWSNLRDYSNFVPDTSSEADSYLCTMCQNGDEVMPGVTGLQNWKEYCVIYTENAIFAMHYTGIRGDNRVVNVRPIVLDYGNGLPWAICALNDTHAFIDTKHENFFYLPNALALSKPDAFGDPIKDYFFNDLNPDFELAAKTFAYKDKQAMEVVWVYVSGNSAGSFDKAVAFNWENNTWSKRDVENIESFVHAGKRAICADELTGAANVQLATTLADKTVVSSETFDRIWGSGTGYVLRESNSNDLDATLMAVNPPLLETGDYIYGTLSQMKEVNRILINAAGTFSGILVYLAVRKFTGEAVTFQYVGTWTPSLVEEILAFPGLAGKIIRYKFIGQAADGKQVRDMVFSSFEEYVSGFGAVK